MKTRMIMTWMQRGGGGILLWYTLSRSPPIIFVVVLFFVSLVVIVVVVITAKNDLDGLLQHLPAPSQSMILHGLIIWLSDGNSAAVRAGGRATVRAFLDGVAGGTDLDRLMVTLESASGAVRVAWQQEWTELTAKNEFQRLLQHLATPCRAMVLPGLNVWLLDGSSATDRAGAREGVRAIMDGTVGGADLDRLMVMLESAPGALRTDWVQDWSRLLAGGNIAGPLNRGVQLRTDGDPADSSLGGGSSTNEIHGGSAVQCLGTTTTSASTSMGEDDGSSASDRKPAAKRCPRDDKDGPASAKRCPRDDSDDDAAAPNGTIG
jgi:hypothetical protein